jgi:chemotaxis protein CheX
MIDDLEQMVCRAVATVFGATLNAPVELEPPGSPVLNGEAQIAGSVGFIGSVCGVLYVYSSARFARVLTTRMLGLREDDPLAEEIVNDAFGELTNMVVGQIKSRLADRGKKCVLTIPSIVRASHFRVDSSASAQAHLCLFRIRGEQVAVEIMVKPAPAEAALAA